MKAHVRHRGGFCWEGIAPGAYKSEGEHFREVTRQLLFGAEAGLPCEVRYFEIAPDGHSTLERHAHAHAVVILRGRGRALVGREILDLGPFDLVRVGPHTWHQFRAAPDAPLGFLCLVACERDRPERPDPAALAALRADPEIARFLG